MCQDLGVNPTYPALDPYPVEDNVGFTVALQMLKASTLSGKYSDDHQQFDTIRSIRTAFYNVYEASWMNNINLHTMKGEKGAILRSTTCPTQSLFFQKFVKGLLGRMGKDIRSNAGLSHEVLILMLDKAEEDLNNDSLSWNEKRFILLCSFYFVVCFGGSLRGSEGFMIERSDLIDHIERGKHDDDIPHVVVPLLGRFKGETGERSHLLLLVNTTSSGIQIRKWIGRVVALLKIEGLEGVGPAMCNSDGSPMSSFEVDRYFKDQLEVVQKKRPDLIESHINVHEDFGIFRSIRKGSESRATEMGVCSQEIDLINRWRKMEGSQRRNMPMRDYYLDMLLIKRRYLRYSQAL